MLFILNRLKAILLAIVVGIKRALCCFRGRKRSYENDSECLTDVVVPNRKDEEFSAWDNKWGDDGVKRPQTIEEHIQMYREKIVHPNVPEVNRDEEVIDNLFQELTPQYIKQKRIVVREKGVHSRTNESDLSRLSVSESGNMTDLGEWLDESSSGWDEQHMDPSDILKEQKRIRRETRQQQQQQNVRIGKKIKT